MKKIIITGNVGNDAESKANPQGETFTTFSVGVKVGTKDKPKTEWIDVSCNGKLADVARAYVKKGGKVLVEGSPLSQAYTKDGVTHSKLKVYANILELLSGPNEESSESASH